MRGLSADQNSVLLDVRSEKEYDEEHMEGAINIPYNNQEELLKLDKNKAYYLHCRIGGRSAVVAYLLAQDGFENVFNLDDDVANILSIYENK